MASQWRFGMRSNATGARRPTHIGGSRGWARVIRRRSSRSCARCKVRGESASMSPTYAPKDAPMKAAGHPPRTTTAQRQHERTNGAHPRQPRDCIGGPNAPQSRAKQKAGGYRRVEVFLAVEAAIALRQLMRDGRTARDVIEALLVAEKGRRMEQAWPSVGP